MEKLNFEVEVDFKVAHHKDFYLKWGSKEVITERANEMLKTGKTNKFSSQPAHGSFDQAPGWKHLGCLGSWRRGDPSYADCHCLEIFEAPNGKKYVVDQSEHGDFRGHEYRQQLLFELQEEP